MGIRRLGSILKQKLFADQESNVVAKNMVASGVCKPISIVISYLYVPIVLKYLGVEKYGIWSTILSILAWISYFDIGIGNGLRNKLTAVLAHHELSLGQKLVSSTYAITSGIMFICTLLLCGIASITDWNSVFGVKDLGEDITYVINTSIVFVTVNFILSICKNVLYALQKASIVSAMELLIQILNFLGVLLISKFSKGNLFLLALTYGGSMLLVNLITSVALYWKNQQLTPKFSQIDIKIGISLTSLGIRFFIIQVCALVLFTTDNLIISMLYGAADVTPYSTVNKLFMAVVHVFTALLSPIWSSVTKAKVENNYRWLKKLIKNLNYLMLPFFCSAIMLAFVFRPISYLWLKQKLHFQTGIISIGAMYCILSIWCNTYSYIANGLELMKVSMIVALIQATINIPLSLFFAEILHMQSAGVLAGTVGAMTISATVMPIFVCKNIKENL